MLHELRDDIERAQALQSLLVSIATGQPPASPDYAALRSYFVDNPSYRELLPSWVRTCRNGQQFWQHIKEAFPTYAERRAYIWRGFEPLLSHLEGRNQRPLDPPASEALRAFNSDGVHAAWQRALDRRQSDPEGAITAARTLLETVCKHILDARQIQYGGRVELHELYRMCAQELRLSPNQHTEEIFKQILGGCSAIVSGLGTLRNRLGDAHGQGQSPVRPAPRHAELAVNLAGAMALFLVSTWGAARGED